MLLSFSFNALAKTGKIVVIIDDMGNNRLDLTFSTLPTAISFAVLPFTPFSKAIANSAYQQQREILLHLPMQAYDNNHLLGKGALTLKMEKQHYEQTINDALLAIPHATGVNNHMGSKLTEQMTAMQWTMELLFQRGVFFVDSRTSAASIAESSAVKAGLPALRRHIFLDNKRDQQSMEEQFQRAIQLSRQSEYCIIIAHPHPETLSYLSQRLAKPSEEFLLMTLNQLIPAQQHIALQRNKLEYQQAKQVYTKSSTPKLQ